MAISTAGNQTARFHQVRSPDTFVAASTRAADAARAFPDVRRRVKIA
jgi:hypothetical protein